MVEHDEDAIRARRLRHRHGACRRGEWRARSSPRARRRRSRRIPNSITGDYLSGRRSIPMPEVRRPLDPKRMLTLVGATGNNLKNVTASFSARLLHLHHRRIRRRQVDPRHRHAVQGGVPPADGFRRGAGPLRKDRGSGAARQDHRHRPVADRPDATLEPRDLNGPVRADPGLVRPNCRTAARAATSPGGSAST